MNRSPNKTAAQWQSLINEFIDSGESDQRDIKLNTLRKWRHQIAAEGKKAAAAHTGKGFVKVSALDKAGGAGSSDVATLHIGTELRLECPASFDVAALAQLALAVHHGR